MIVMLNAYGWGYAVGMGIPPGVCRVRGVLALVDTPTGTGMRSPYPRGYQVRRR